MSDTIVSSSDASFDTDVLQADGPVLVDFWATWCGPCRQLAPTLEQVATEHAGKLKVVKVDVDENQATAAKFGIRSIPTLMMFKDGKPVETKMGNLPKPQLVAFVGNHLA